VLAAVLVDVHRTSGKTFGIVFDTNDPCAGDDFGTVLYGMREVSEIG
jgi:hypothetical protein